MKKLLLFAFILCSLTCSAQKHKSFYYDGIELRNVKKWTIVPSKDASITTITCIQLPYQLQITKQSIGKNFDATRYLENTIEQLMEINLMSNKKSPKIKEVSDIYDGYVNNIPAKCVNIIFTKNNTTCLYVFTIHDQMFVINCSGVGPVKKIQLVSNLILSTFTYNPERNPYGSLF